MNKRILSIFLCLMLVASLLVMAVPASAAASADLTVTADKTQASKGDTVNFTVSLGAASQVGIVQFDINIPTGLTPVSASVSNGFQGAADWDKCEAGVAATKDCVTIAAMVKANDVDLNAMDIATFSCTVNDDVTAGATLSTTFGTVILCSFEDDVVETDVNPTGASVEIIDKTQDETKATEPDETKATESDETKADETKADETKTVETTGETKTTETTVDSTAPAGTTAPKATTPATVVKPTSKPAAPASKDAATKDAASAKTGDSTHMYLWMIIMFASLAGVAVVLYTAKRKGLLKK